jgi:Uma2 family endonuclease
MPLVSPLTIDDFEKLPDELAYYHPDLAIEIVSGSDTFAKLVMKATRYRQCGTKEAWILDIGDLFDQI